MAMSEVDYHRIWATRPAYQNAAWITSLSQFGLPVVDLPLLKIEPVQQADQTQAIKNLILDFDQFHKVIFVSQNAVREALVWLRDYWPQLPVGIEYFAVGSKTAESLLEEGLQVVSGSQSMDSDELLSFAQLQNVWGQKILICRGVGGLPRLGQTLQERGAIVRYLELYQRLLPPDATAMARDYCNADLDKDLVPIFSSETLANLVEVLTANGIQQRTMTLVVPGKRVAQAAAQHGFNKVLVAENATAKHMLAALENCLKNQ
jgi:uroporphyrinogen-III synthase